MKKRIFTLIAFAALFLTGFAQQAGDLVYTADGRYKINTGENMISNGNFAEGYADWTTDSGTPLEASVFSIQHGGPDGNDYLMVLYKEDGPGTPTTLMRKVPVIAGQSYYISYYVKADQTVTTTITPTEKKNYQNIFYNADGSLTPEVAIAKVQDFGEEWRKLEYSYTAASDGYVVLHIFGSYTGTCFANFTMMNVTPMADDRKVNKLIDRLQGYIDNPLFPNENEMLENIIAMLRDMMDTADCYPIHHTKATFYDAYGQLSEPGTQKIGFHLADSVACHVDLDVESFRIIGWTQDQVDEYFMGREFAEAKQELLDAIGQARQLLTDDHYFYARQLLTDSIARSQSVYDGSHNIDSISNQTKRMNRAISYFKQQNAEFTPFVEDIEKAEQLLADYGLTVNLPGKNQTVMSIDRLNEGDQVVVDWAFANASHGLYVTSANTSYQKADGTTVTLTKSGKDSSNQLPRDDNQDGLNGYQRTTFTMTAPGALEFYLGSSNSTLRISYVGITYADVTGISDAARLTNNERVNSTVYDLQGRRVQQGAMKRGLYVVNGKKFFVR